MSLFGNKTESYLGVDLGAHGVKMVELRKTKGRPQLWTYGIASDPLDVHASAHAEGDLISSEVSASSASLHNPDLSDQRVHYYANLLRETGKQARITTRRATASLPVSQVFHTIVTLPIVPDKELDHHVRAKVKKMLPQPIEEMQVVHQKIKEKNLTAQKDFVRVLVTAAPRSLVDFYTKIFTEAGFELQELETEAFALERSLVGIDTATAMIIDIGAQRTNFFVVDQELPITHRSIQIGGRQIDTLLENVLGISQASAEQAKFDIARIVGADIPPELFEDVADPIIKEIEHSMDLFLHQTGNEGKRIEKIILTGGIALFTPLVEYIRSRFSIKVFAGDPWARVVYQQGLKGVLDEIGPRMSVAIGLAMRNII